MPKEFTKDEQKLIDFIDSIEDLIRDIEYTREMIYTVGEAREQEYRDRLTDYYKELNNCKKSLMGWFRSLKLYAKNK